MGDAGIGAGQSCLTWVSCRFFPILHAPQVGVEALGELQAGLLLTRKKVRQRRIIARMYSILETATFMRCAANVWNDAELMEFKLWLASNPLSGDVIAGAGGLRKVRWSRAGMGKRGGARVVYFNQLGQGVIALLMVYTKAKLDNLPTEFLLRLKQELNDAQS
jgi:hypothetical protein